MILAGNKISRVRTIAVTTNSSRVRTSAVRNISRVGTGLVTHTSIVGTGSDKTNNSTVRTSSVKNHISTVRSKVAEVWKDGRTEERKD